MGDFLVFSLSMFRRNAIVFVGCETEKLQLGHKEKRKVQVMIVLKKIRYTLPTLLCIIIIK